MLKKALINFNPEPLVADSDCDVLLTQKNIIVDKVGTKININNKKFIHFASHNYLNLINNAKITTEAISTIKKYGVGSCGPRGFYGTVDVHLDLEERIARFMNMEEAVVYSYWFSTVASAIPAYCKRNDAIFCDEMISFAAQKGLDAAKCNVIYFKHNDADDLEEKIIQFNEQYANKKKKPRKFLVLEGIYSNTGNICNLPAMIELRSKYKMRLFLDESVSIGVLGKTGRGIVEHFNVNPIEVDMIIGSLEGLIGSIGGFCVGSHFIIEHQRLSGLGYCFSASLPPVLTRAAYSAFDYIDDNSPKLCADLRTKCSELHSLIKNISKMEVISDKWSPVKYLVYPGCDTFDAYKSFANKCEEGGVILSVYKNTSTEKWQIMLCVNIEFTDEELNTALKVMKTAAVQCFT